MPTNFKTYTAQNLEWTTVIFISAVTVMSVILRLVLHWPNFSPVLGFALFAGLRFESWTARLLVPVVALFLGDLILSGGDLSFVFHGVFVYVWVSVFLCSLVGIFARRELGVPFWVKGIASAFVGSMLFFLVTNFAVWKAGDGYPATWKGLIQCYVLALPFFNNTLTSSGLYLFTFEGLRRIHSWWVEAQAQQPVSVRVKK